MAQMRFPRAVASNLEDTHMKDCQTTLDLYPL